MVILQSKMIPESVETCLANSNLTLVPLSERELVSERLV